MSDTGQDRAAAVAAAVLYRGSRLSPSRAVDAPDRFRWQFGVLSPPDAVARDVGEDAMMVTDCLVVDEPAAELRVRVRFLQLQNRGVEQLVSAHDQPPEFAPVVELDCGAGPWPSQLEEVEHDIHVAVRELGELGRSPVDQLLYVPGTRQLAPLHNARGGQRGRVVRTRQPVDVHLRITVEHRIRGVRRLRCELVNATASDEVSHGSVQRTARERALYRSLLSPHLLLSVTRGRFLSVLDPPGWAEELALSCVHHRLWPVLADDHGEDRSVLVSPVILPDRPHVTVHRARFLRSERAAEHDIPVQRRTS